MTNPIPGADSERAAFEAWAATEGHTNFYRTAGDQRRYDDLQLRGKFKAWQAARAAAKVGVNVAADIDRLSDELRRAHTLHFNYVYEVSRIARQESAICNFPETDEVRALIDSLSEQVIAAGAPAETPKPVAGRHYLPDGNLFNDGKCFETHDSYEDAQEAQRAYGGTITPLYAAQPAPIAGDVEKDALDAKRYRKIKADNDDCDAETFCLFFDSKSGGLISIESKDMDAELDAAMLANSSSGEAA